MNCEIYLVFFDEIIVAGFSVRVGESFGEPLSFVWDIQVLDGFDEALIFFAGR